MSTLVLEKTQALSNADFLQDSRNNFILDRIVTHYSSFENEKERLHAVRKINELRNEIDDFNQLLQIY